MIKKRIPTIYIAIFAFIFGMLLTFLTGCSQPVDLGKIAVEKIKLTDSLKSKTYKEKANTKSKEIAKLKIEKFNKKELEIEIIGDITEIEGGVQIFAKAWKGGNQLGFGKDGSVEIERFLIYNPPVLVDDPNGDIIINWNDELSGEPKQRKLKEDPEEATKQVLSHTIKIVGKDGKNIIKGKVGNTTTTLFPGNDGRTREIDTAGLTWATLVGGGGDQVNVGSQNRAFLFRADGNSNKWDILDRYLATLDGSAISGDDTVDSATFSIMPKEVNDNTGDADMGVYEASPASDSSIVAGDFNSVGTTLFASAVALSAMTAETYIDYSFNSTGITYIEARIADDGIFNLGTRNDNYDAQEERAGSASPAWVSGRSDGVNCYNIAESGTAKDPQLIIEHTGEAVRRIINIE